MAGGYVGPYIPPSFLTPEGNYYITVGNHLGPEQAADVRAFVAEKGVTAVVVDGDEASFFNGALDAISRPRSTGGVVLYRLSGSAGPCP
jgi:hypothetical protein